MNQGCMRLGGMTPAECCYDLPTTFHISKILESENLLTFFCNHNDFTGKELVWESKESIRIDGRSIPLHCSPSYRTSWCTFTIRPLTLFEDNI